MGVPDLDHLEDILIDTSPWSDQVQDPEIDIYGSPPRINWTGEQPLKRLWVADLDVQGGLLGVDWFDQDLGPNNQAEWGRLTGFPGKMGLYYHKDTGPGLVSEVWEVDPEPGYGPVPVYSDGAGIDLWVLDAWRVLKDPADPLGLALSDNPLILIVRQYAGGEITEGQVWILDPNQFWRPGYPIPTRFYPVPNFRLFLEQRGSRALNIVADRPAIVLVYYHFPAPLILGGRPFSWELRWQEVDDTRLLFSGESFFVFPPPPLTPLRDYPDQSVIGVDVRKLDPATFPNAFGIQPLPEGELYFVYVLRRDRGPGPPHRPTDHIDFYLFDYHRDPNDPIPSAVLLSGTVPFPAAHAPYVYIGDNESNVNPIGNPCIIMTAASSPTVDIFDDQPTILVLFTFNWRGVDPSAPDPGFYSRFDVLTPTTPAVARKDPEPVTLRDASGEWVYIYYRRDDGQLPLQQGGGVKWALHRALAWSPLLR